MLMHRMSRSCSGRSSQGYHSWRAAIRSEIFTCNGTADIEDFARRAMSRHRADLKSSRSSCCSMRDSSRARGTARDMLLKKGPTLRLSPCRQSSRCLESTPPCPQIPTDEVRDLPQQHPKITQVSLPATFTPCGNRIFTFP